ncbi:MAG: TIGR01212 family radical SAM protein [Thiohalomonadaceae bacterium]
MILSKYVNTFGRAMMESYGARVHKVTVDAGFTCPNRDGSKGRGGCTFCNNTSFSPNGRMPAPIPTQLANGRAVIARRTRARRFVAYFQAYTNTYDDPAVLQQRYDLALSQPGVIGLSVGTRPDCVPDKVLDMLACYRDRGFEVWLELGLQSSFDATLARVNRGHGFTEYREAVRAAHRRGLKVCTHLILGLPEETAAHAHITLDRVLDLGVEGLKFHPLHVVKGTRLALAWRRGEYAPWSEERYVCVAGELIRRTPREVIFHRLTGTASANLLLAPAWCGVKWRVLNGLTRHLAVHGAQGSAVGQQAVDLCMGD